MQPEIQELIDDFALFEDWEERYTYLIDLGKTLPPMDETLKTDASLVSGCISKVWMVPEFNDGKFSFVADSDAHIVRGLIGVLMRVYQGRSLSEMQEIDMHAVFRELGLESHITPNRRNGFFSMVQRIRSYSELGSA